MTMPRNWKYEVLKEKKEEMDKILDYYYEVVKPLAQDPNATEEEREASKTRYWKMRNDKEAQILAHKMGIEDGQVKTLEDLEKNEIFRKKREEIEALKKDREESDRRERQERRRQQEIKERGDKIAAALIFAFIPAVIIVPVVGVLTLNWYVLIPGLIMFGILGAVASLGQHGTGHAGYYMWGAGRGRAWRMYAVHKATSK